MYMLCLILAIRLRCRHNGRYYLQQTEGGRHLAQDMLLKNIILRYLDKPESSSQPFFIYFAARAIHV